MKKNRQVERILKQMHNIVNQLLYGTVVPTLCKNICADTVIIPVTSKLGL